MTNKKYVHEAYGNMQSKKMPVNVIVHNADQN